MATMAMTTFTSTLIRTIKAIKDKKNDKDSYVSVVEQRAASKVRSMGYRVKDVKYKNGDRKIKIKAERGRDDYKIELGYPSYNVIKLKKD